MINIKKDLADIYRTICSQRTLGRNLIRRFLIDELKIHLDEKVAAQLIYEHIIVCDDTNNPPASIEYNDHIVYIAYQDVNDPPLQFRTLLICTYLITTEYINSFRGYGGHQPFIICLESLNEPNLHQQDSA